MPNWKDPYTLVERGVPWATMIMTRITLRNYNARRTRIATSTLRSLKHAKLSIVPLHTVRHPYLEEIKSVHLGYTSIFIDFSRHERLLHTLFYDYLILLNFFSSLWLGRNLVLCIVISVQVFFNTDNLFLGSGDRMFSRGWISHAVHPGCRLK